MCFLPGRTEVKLEPTCWNFDSCCCSSEVTPDAFHKVEMAGEKDTAGCSYSMLDCVDCKMSLTRAVMSLVSTLVPLVVHWAAQLAERSVGHFAEHSAGHSDVCFAEQLGGFVGIFGVASDVAVIDVAVSEDLAAVVGLMVVSVAGDLAVEIRVECFDHFVVAEDWQTSHNEPRDPLLVADLEVYFVEKL